jgi:hypothetical protein
VRSKSIICLSFNHRSKVLIACWEFFEERAADAVGDGAAALFELVLVADGRMRAPWHLRNAHLSDSRLLTLGIELPLDEDLRGLRREDVIVDDDDFFIEEAHHPCLNLHPQDISFGLKLRALYGLGPLHFPAFDNVQQRPLL